MYCADIAAGDQACVKDKGKLRAYAVAMEDAVVICPWAWREFSGLMTLGNKRKTDLTRFGGTHIEQLQSLSAAILHELAHIAGRDDRFPPPGTSGKLYNGLASRTKRD